MSILDLIKTGINTLRFNYCIFGLNGLLKFQVIIGPRIKFGSLSRGSITIYSKGIARLRIGVGEGSFHHGRSLYGYVNLEKDCKLSILGKASMAQGIVLNISRNAICILGDKFSANYGCTISIAKSLKTDSNVRLGWNVSILDSDGHVIIDRNKQQTNPNLPIYIGNNVWIAAKATIMKGTKLEDNTIIPYGSIITKSNLEKNCIFGGMPNHILKNNVHWDYESEK